MLTLDVSHRVLNQRTVYEFIQDCVNNSKKGGGSWQELFKKGVIGCIVMTKYNNKTYRIDDVVFDQSPKTTFEVKDGNSLTYADYYQQQYGITIRDPNQPILVNLKRVRTLGESEKKEFFLGLIPELCQMTGLTDEMRSSFTIMKDLATHTKLSPALRLGSFKEFLARVNGSEKAMKILNDWGLSLAKSPIGVTARVLEEEMIFFGEGKKQSTGQNADFSRGATSNAVLEVFDLTSWMLIFDKRDKTIADNFEKTLSIICGPTGIRCNAGMFLSYFNCIFIRLFSPLSLSL
jgi:aubergine